MRTTNFKSTAGAAIAAVLFWTMPADGQIQDVTEPEPGSPTQTEAVENESTLPAEVAAKTDNTPVAPEADEIDLPPMHEYSIDAGGATRYTTYEATDISGMSPDEVIIGLITNSLPKEKRYIEIVADRNPKDELKPIPFIETSISDYKMETVGSDVTISPPVMLMAWDEQENFASSLIGEKHYFITTDGEYKYSDGKKIVGDKSTIDRLSDGKPITETTFYYHMQEAGMISPKITFKDFSKMTVDQQVKLIEIALKNTDPSEQEVFIVE